VIDVDGVQIGGPKIVMMAGPCSVESRSMILEVAHAVKEAGGSVLRGGAFKPRSSPYSFQGLGEED
jgi:3-deoxy-7-phosphoheptulonate synthase